MKSNVPEEVKTSYGQLECSVSSAVAAVNPEERKCLLQECL